MPKKAKSKSSSQKIFPVLESDVFDSDAECPVFKERLESQSKEFDNDSGESGYNLLKLLTCEACDPPVRTFFSILVLAIVVFCTLASLIVLVWSAVKGVTMATTIGGICFGCSCVLLLYCVCAMSKCQAQRHYSVAKRRRLDAEKSQESRSACTKRALPSLPPTATV